MSTSFPHGSNAADGRHPVHVDHLVMGVVFLGIVVVWALVQADLVGGDDVRWLLPVPWVLAGGAGLLATTLSGRRRREEAARWYPGGATPYDTDAYGAYQTPTARTTPPPTPATTRPTRPTRPRRPDERHPHRPHPASPSSRPGRSPATRAQPRRPDGGRRLLRGRRLPRRGCDVRRLDDVPGPAIGFGTFLLAYLVAWVLLPEA